jgi:hypothetical protein
MYARVLQDALLYSVRCSEQVPSEGNELPIGSGVCVGVCVHVCTAVGCML